MSKNTSCMYMWACSLCSAHLISFENCKKVQRMQMTCCFFFPAKRSTVDPNSTSTWLFLFCALTFNQPNWGTYVCSVLAFGFVSRLRWTLRKSSENYRCISLTQSKDGKEKGQSFEAQEMLFGSFDCNFWKDALGSYICPSWGFNSFCNPLEPRNGKQVNVALGQHTPTDALGNEPQVWVTPLQRCLQVIKSVPD